MITIALLGATTGALMSAFRAADAGNRPLTLASLIVAVAAALALVANTLGAWGGSSQVGWP